MLNRLLIILSTIIFGMLLASCGPGDSSSSSAPTYTLNGSISGLTSGSVTLQDTKYKDPQDNSLTFYQNGSFTLNTNYLEGDKYAIVVSQQPQGLNCTVANSEGKFRGGNVIDIKVTCTPYIYVTSGHDATVSMFATDGSGNLSALSPSTVITGDNNNPQGIVIHPNNTFAYVADFTSSSVSMYRIGNNAVLTPLSPATVTAGNGPSAIAINPAGTYAYVANFDSNRVSVFSIRSDGILFPLLLATVPVGNGPNAIAINPAGTYAYVVNYFGGVSMFSIGTDGKLTPLSPATAPTGYDPSAIAINPAGTYAYVTNLASNTLSMFAIGGNGILTPLSPATVVTTQPSAIIINPAGTYAYVFNATPDLVANSTISMYSINSNGMLTPLATPTISLGVPSTASSMAMDPSGNFIYLALYRGSKVLTFAIGSDGILTLLNTPAAPTGLAPKGIAITH